MAAIFSAGPPPEGQGGPGQDPDRLTSGPDARIIVAVSGIRSGASIIVLTAVALSLLQRPGLAEEIPLGRVREIRIRTMSETWRSGQDAYAPEPADVRAIAALRRPAVLEVYFGSWCSDSRREIPRLLAILDAAGPLPLKTRFYGVDRTKKEPARTVAKVDLKRVPTFVLRVEGEEIGRIVERPETTLEHDLALIVDRIPASRP